MFAALRAVEHSRSDCSGKRSSGGEVGYASSICCLHNYVGSLSLYYTKQFGVCMRCRCDEGEDRRWRTGKKKEKQEQREQDCANLNDTSMIGRLGQLTIHLPDLRTLLFALCFKTRSKTRLCGASRSVFNYHHFFQSFHAA